MKKLEAEFRNKPDEEFDYWHRVITHEEKEDGVVVSSQRMTNMQYWSRKPELEHRVPTFTPPEKYYCLNCK